MHGGCEFKKKSSTIDLDSVDKKGDNQFRRFEFWGIGQHFMLHYIGDDTLYQGFSHRNSKNNSKSFVRSAPHVKDKVSKKSLVNQLTFISYSSLHCKDRLSVMCIV